MKLITDQQFDEQIQKLKTRFGDRAFDDEFVALIDAELQDITPRFFAMTVANLIGGRRPNDPPLLIHFKEAFIAERKRQFEKGVSHLSSEITKGMQKPLDQILAEKYPGCKTLKEAWDLERKRVREGDL